MIEPVERTIGIMHSAIIALSPSDTARISLNEIALALHLASGSLLLFILLTFSRAFSFTAFF